MAKSERMVQHSYTGPIRPKVKIISHTTYPIGSLFVIWSGTRYPDIMNPEDIQRLYDLPADVHNFRDTMKPLIEVADTICKWYPEYAGEEGKDYKNVIHVKKTAIPGFFWQMRDAV